MANISSWRRIVLAFFDFELFGEDVSSVADLIFKIL